MTKTKQKSRPSSAQTKSPGGRVKLASQSKDVAFSVRLTVEEHEFLKQAAALRGWTATNLIRTATLDRAAHILNTSQPRRAHFKGLADAVAEQLFGQRTYYRQTAENRDEWESFDPTALYGIEPSFRVEPDRLNVDKVKELSEAARLGGAEFLNLILESCDGVTAPERGDLPAPIDPARWRSPT